MDPYICHCRGPCNAHMCIHQQREILRQCCPEALNASLKCPTQPVTDANGRFVCPEYKRGLPWSNYLEEKWNPCANNLCKRKHVSPRLESLPRSRPMLVRDAPGNQPQSKSEISEDELVEREFQQLRQLSLPVIWIFGHAHQPAGPSRTQFGKELAYSLGFKNLDMECQVRYWAAKLCNFETPAEVLCQSPSIKQLMRMCVQLMGDNELHLNTAGTVQLVKLAMLCTWLEAQRNGSMPVRGFVIGGFPCSKKEADLFEMEIGEVSMGLYFAGRCWSLEGVERQEPKVHMPCNFRRDTEYLEGEVEKTADSYGRKTIKVMNLEDMKDYEADFVIDEAKKRLGIGYNSGGIEIKMVPFGGGNFTQNMSGGGEQQQTGGGEGLRAMGNEPPSYTMKTVTQMYGKKLMRKCVCCAGGNLLSRAGKCGPNAGYEGGNSDWATNSGGENVAPTEGYKQPMGSEDEPLVIICPLPRPPKPRPVREWVHRHRKDNCIDKHCQLGETSEHDCPKDQVGVHQSGYLSQEFVIRQETAQNSSVHNTTANTNPPQSMEYSQTTFSSRVKNSDLSHSTEINAEYHRLYTPTKVSNKESRTTQHSTFQALPVSNRSRSTSPIRLPPVYLLPLKSPKHMPSILHPEPESITASTSMHEKRDERQQHSSFKTLSRPIIACPTTPPQSNEQPVSIPRKPSRVTRTPPSKSRSRSSSPLSPVKATSVPSPATDNNKNETLKAQKPLTPPTLPTILEEDSSVEVYKTQAPILITYTASKIPIPSESQTSKIVPNARKSRSKQRGQGSSITLRSTTPSMPISRRNSKQLSTKAKPPNPTSTKTTKIVPSVNVKPRSVSKHK